VSAEKESRPDKQVIGLSLISLARFNLHSHLHFVLNYEKWSADAVGSADKLSRRRVSS
jgi:hypothetical protein